MGHASLLWAFAEAAMLGLRVNPAGQKYFAHLTHPQGTGQALTVLAHPWACAAHRVCEAHVPTWARERRGRAHGLTGHRGDQPGADALEGWLHGGFERTGARRPLSPLPSSWGDFEMYKAPTS
jgi:hypothetical protein